MKKKYVQILLFVGITVLFGFMIGTTMAMISNNSQSRRVITTKEPDKEISKNEENQKDNEEKPKEKDGNIDNQKNKEDKENKENTDDTIVVKRPSALESSETTSTTTKLTWSAPESTTGLVSYTIYNGKDVIAEVPAETTSYIIEGLSANSIYSFRMTSNYSNGESSNAINVNVRTTK